MREPCCYLAWIKTGIPPLRHLSQFNLNSLSARRLLATLLSCCAHPQSQVSQFQGSIRAKMSYQSIGSAAAVAVALLYVLRLALLPKPLPGIPYNKSAANSVLGDIGEIQKTSKTNVAAWMAAQPERHASPICQVFLGPLSQPAIVVADFREAQDILVRRTEFDRSDFFIDCLGGETPKFQLVMKTGPEWKAHRRLTQDLMSPYFLHKVASPHIYESLLRLLDIWAVKEVHCHGKAFSASQDIFYAALDAVLDTTFGNSMPERALIPQYKMMECMTTEDWTKSTKESQVRDSYVFPTAKIYPALDALLHTLDNVTKVVASGFPKIGWWMVGLLPKVRKTRAARDAMIEEQIMAAASRLETDSVADSDEKVQSAIDLILRRERTLARKEDREPVSWSDVMKDEVCGPAAAKKMYDIDRRPLDYRVS